MKRGSLAAVAAVVGALRQANTGASASRTMDAPDGALTEVVRARGHENVSGTHESTFELTTDDWLTPAGDCIVGVEADRSPAEFDPAFVEACQDADATVTVTLAVDDHEQTVTGRGDPQLTFESDRSAVIRTSDYVDDRTVCVGADAAAADLDRDPIAALSGGASVTATLRVRGEE